MKKYLQKGINAVSNVLFPVTCPVCGDIVVPKGRRICSECRNRLPYLKTVCLRCGQPVAGTVEFCDVCAGRERAFERGAAVFEYNELMQRMIGDFKFRSRKDYSDFFADELEMRFRQVYEGLKIQAFVPVPIHPSRKRFRGYNQSELLCEGLSKRLDIPVYDCLFREKRTMPSKKLDPAERRKNLSGAMKFKEPEEFVKAGFKPETVCIVDDIYTTGATVEACTDIMKSNGIKSVFVLNIAIGNKIN